MLGLAAEVAGASAIVQVDASERALAFAAAHHVLAPARHTFVVADVFAWLPAFTAELFDLVIVDPPAMTSKATQVASVLGAYRKLYRAAALPHVRPGAARACRPAGSKARGVCQTVGAALGSRFSLRARDPPEPDHPVGFPQSRLSQRSPGGRSLVSRCAASAASRMCRMRWTGRPQRAATGRFARSR
jgi:hypothetical protein